MKNTIKTKKGISLILLVITIIVMIILAAAIILSLNNSGIIGKANKAKKDSDAANLKEYLNILQAEYELMTESERAGKTSTEYVNQKLDEKGYKRRLNEDGILLTENAVVAIDAGIEIGDVVTGYILDTSDSKKVYDTKTGIENTAPTGLPSAGTPTPQPNLQRIEYSADEWKYIGISDDGEVLIAPVMESSVTENQEIKLSGKGGYKNGPQVLNAMCEALYSTTKGTARSMNIEDINRILEYTPAEAKKIGDMEKEIGTSLSSRITPETGKDIEDYYVDYYSLSKTSNDILKSLDTGETDDTDRKNLLLNFVYTSEEYWLASSYVWTNVISDTAEWGVRCVGRNAVSGYDFFNSWGDERYNTCAVRPVVALHSNIQLTKVSDGNWSI